MDLGQPQAWDQQEGEPTQWFVRFELYRLAGPSRSLLHFYSAERIKAGKGAAQTISGAWQKQVTLWRWKERAEAWDQVQLAELRETGEQAFRRQLELHRQRSLRVAKNAMDTAEKLLEKTTSRLLAIKPSQIPVKSIPAYLRAAASVAEASLNAEAQALSVEELLRELDGNLDHGA